MQWIDRKCYFSSQRINWIGSSLRRHFISVWMIIVLVFCDINWFTSWQQTEFICLEHVGELWIIFSILWWLFQRNTRRWWLIMTIFCCTTFWVWFDDVTYLLFTFLLFWVSSNDFSFSSTYSLAKPMYFFILSTCFWSIITKKGSVSTSFLSSIN